MKYYQIPLMQEKLFETAIESIYYAIWFDELNDFLDSQKQSGFKLKQRQFIYQD